MTNASRSSCWSTKLRDTTLTNSLRILPAPYWRHLAGVRGSGLSAGTIAIQFYALDDLLYAAGACPAGAFADSRKGRFLTAAYALAALMDLLLAFAAPSIAILLLVFVLAGAGYALQQFLERAIAAGAVASVVALLFGERRGRRLRLSV